MMPESTQRTPNSRLALTSCKTESSLRRNLRKRLLVNWRRRLYATKKGENEATAPKSSTCCEMSSVVATARHLAHLHVACPRCGHESHLGIALSGRPSSEVLYHLKSNSKPGELSSGSANCKKLLTKMPEEFARVFSFEPVEQRLGERTHEGSAGERNARTVARVLLYRDTKPSEPEDDGQRTILTIQRNSFVADNADPGCTVASRLSLTVGNALDTATVHALRSRLQPQFSQAAFQLTPRQGDRSATTE